MVGRWDQKTEIRGYVIYKWSLTYLFFSILFHSFGLILSHLLYYFSAVDDSPKELTESKADDSLDDFYPDESVENKDDEIYDYSPFVEIGPKDNWSALPGNISFIFNSNIFLTIFSVKFFFPIFNRTYFPYFKSNFYMLALPKE